MNSIIVAKNSQNNFFFQNLNSEGHVRHEMVKPEKIGSALANRQKSELNVTKPFYEELVEVLSFLRSGTSDFLFYLEQVNISVQFQAGNLLPPSIWSMNNELN